MALSIPVERHTLENGLKIVHRPKLSEPPMASGATRKPASSSQFLRWSRSICPQMPLSPNWT